MKPVYTHCQRCGRKVKAYLCEACRKSLSDEEVVRRAAEYLRDDPKLRWERFRAVQMRVAMDGATR